MVLVEMYERSDMFLISEYYFSIPVETVEYEFNSFQLAFLALLQLRYKFNTPTLPKVLQFSSDG